MNRIGSFTGFWILESSPDIKLLNQIRIIPHLSLQPVWQSFLISGGLGVLESMQLWSETRAFLDFCIQTTGRTFSPANATETLNKLIN